ncbi:DUF2914 domain-containing protein [Candidatus Kaiserbacteria bacterium]|nr:DUF2914 domain-containing protein [Candidatus Kaiserbacteria bacterium]
MASRYFPKSTEELVRWYERYVSPFALILGFLADNFFFFSRVDSLQTHLLFFFYLLVVGSCILLIHFIQAGKMRDRRIVNMAPFIPVVMQFMFGNLFSGYLALYSRSASIAVSWIFVVVLAGLLIGNERFRNLYTRFTFQISLYFTVLFSFLIFFLPTVFLHIGPWMFVLSGVVSLIAIALFMLLLNRFLPMIVRADFRRTLAIIITIFATFNILYFADLIPPVPIALKEAGVYHKVTRTQSGDYELLAEPVPWYESYLRYNTAYHVVAGEGVYVYSAVFAPTGLSTGILHEWQRFDEISERWIDAGTLRFAITGGREGGYRGYSLKSFPAPGTWRVNVITEYGKLVGRVSFRVIPVATSVPLISLTK